MGIGKTLSNLLSEQNRNPNELAEKINESPSTIYSIIRRDNMKVDISVLAKICRELNVNMELFYNEYITDASNDDLRLTSHERKVIIAYRSHISEQSTIDKILDIEVEETSAKKQA